MQPRDFDIIRVFLGIKSYGQLAAVLGISPPTLYRYRTGKRPVPVYIALACTALVLGLKPYQSEQP